LTVTRIGQAGEEDELTACLRSPQHVTGLLRSWRYCAPDVLGGAMIDGGEAIIPRESSIPFDADGCAQPI
jgi:hypothetical protein